MLTIARYSTPIAPAVCQAILELVSDNATSLSMTRPPLEHPLYDGYRALIVEEIRTYITRHDFPQIEVLTAATVDGQVIGFLLFGLVMTDVLECNIYYTAVHRRFRRKGAMTQMMNSVMEISTTLALSCDPSMVQIYERFGFMPADVRETQVVMFIGKPQGITPVVDPTDLMRLEVVDRAFREAMEKTNKRDLKHADKRFQVQITKMKTRAKEFLEARRSKAQEPV
jgi:GNAT superfamily N-acetyltransferase